MMKGMKEDTLMTQLDIINLNVQEAYIYKEAK